MSTPSPRFYKIGFWLLATLLVASLAVAFVATQGQISAVLFCLETVVGGI
jgi:hypothetical protein